MPRPIVVVGAGAAGLMAAIAAAGAAPATPVIVLERTTDGGRKILISGGGRCNVLPAALEPERFVTDSPAHLLRGLLRSWPLARQRAFFEEEAGVPLSFEGETSKYFPASNRARDVRDALVARARRLGARFELQTEATALGPDPGGWQIETSRGPIAAAAVVLATGGLSVPTTGSDGFGLRAAAALGHTVHDTYPALTSLVAAGAPHAHLSGVSLTVRLRAPWRDRTTEARGGLLFTHRGYSGPAVLDISHVAVRSRIAGDPAVVRVQWSPLDADQWRRELAASTGHVVTALARHLPQRLAAALVAESGAPADRRVPELRRSERTTLIERLTACVLPWSGDDGYRKAEVTGGGVALDEIEPVTLESRRHPHLYLCGELLDAFGPIGGHNFAWAWATGRRAGLGAARSRERFRYNRPNG